MQDPSHPLAQLLRQLAALGRAAAIQGQQEVSVHLGSPRQTTTALVLFAVIALTMPASMAAPSAANDNREG